MGSKFLVSFVVLIGAFLMFYFGAWGQWREFSNLREKTARVEAASTQQEQAVKALHALKKQMEERSEDIERVRQIFLESGNIEDAVRLAELLSSTYGLALVNVTLGQKYGRQEKEKAATSQTGQVLSQGKGEGDQQSEEVIQVIPVSVRLAGGYENFKMLLAGSEKTLPLAWISRFSVSPPQKEEETLYLFDLTFEFFTLE